MIEALAVVVVHEEMVDEGAAPGRHGSEEVAQRQEPGATAAPREQSRKYGHHIH